VTREPIRHVVSVPDSVVRLEITPEQVGWRYLSFKIVALEPNATFTGETGPNEMALIPLAGSARFEFAGQKHLLSRRDVFTEKPHVAYLPPRTPYSIAAVEPFEVAIAGAPAEGRFPARVFTPAEMPTFVRGGANVSRGVTSTLDPSFPAERLIAYEVVTPSGNWSSWPPHRHDGRFGSTYHEETYYFRLQPEDGFAIERLYTRDTDLDLSIPAFHGDLVLVHEGYHTVAVAPGTNAYYLNFLAGEVRPVTQFIDPAFGWVANDWEGRPVPIPAG
jgi:5-deoxy-glucuronate isomerase